MSLNINPECYSGGMPIARRNDPLHVQIHDHFARAIAEGELQPGQQLPTMQQIATEWGVSHQTAVRAVEWLRTAGLVTTSRQGSFVADARLVLGPQQRLRLTKQPESERVEVTAAGIVPAPDYIVPILGLYGTGEPMPGGAHWVIRREQVHYDRDDTPFMLAVSWIPSRFADLIPELAAPEPIPVPGGAAVLIERRTGAHITNGRQVRECRHIKDDGREGPLLNLDPDDPAAFVLAEIYVWMDEHDLIEYGEFCLIPLRVTENEFSVG